MENIFSINIYWSINFQNSGISSKKLVFLLKNSLKNIHVQWLRVHLVKKDGVLNFDIWLIFMWFNLVPRSLKRDSGDRTQDEENIGIVSKKIKHTYPKLQPKLMKKSVTRMR